VVNEIIFINDENTDYARSLRWFIILFVGIGFVVVGLPSIKCVEPTLES
jgi:hypothetical protein